MGRKLGARDAAAKAGLSRYFTGKPCKHGHVAERTTEKGECIRCRSIRRSIHQREHRIKAEAALKVIRDLGIEV